MAFSPNGQTVATASADGTARLWATTTAKPLGMALRHQGPVRSVAFSPDGQTILTGSYDGTGRLWHLPVPVTGDIQRIGLWLQVLSGMELDSDGMVHVLDAPTWHQRRQGLQELGGPSS